MSITRQGNYEFSGGSVPMYDDEDILDAETLDEPDEPTQEDH